MGPRKKVRLQKDYEELLRLTQGRNSLVSFEHRGNPPTYYRFTIRLTGLNPSRGPQTGHTVNGRAPSTLHHPVQSVMINLAPRSDPLKLHDPSPLLPDHQVSSPAFDQRPLEIQNTVHGSMTLSDRSPCPLTHILHHHRWRHRQEIPISKQFRQPGLPQAVNALLPGQLTIVIHTGVERNMGIGHIMPQVRSSPENIVCTPLHHGVHEAAIGPLDVPRQHPISPECVFVARLNGAAEPRRRPQRIQTSQG